MNEKKMFLPGVNLISCVGFIIQNIEILQKLSDLKTMLFKISGKGWKAFWTSSYMWVFGNETL